MKTQNNNDDTISLVISVSEAKSLIEYMEKYGVEAGVIRFRKHEVLNSKQRDVATIHTVDCTFFPFASDVAHKPINPFFPPIERQVA
jgi:hypothetical protein